MNIHEVEEKLKQELNKRGLDLVWTPEPDQLQSDELVVFGAEQSTTAGKTLIAGVGPGGSSERYGNSPSSDITNCLNKFLEALEVVGIPQASLHSKYPHVGRGKIWPTFVACLTQKVFRGLKAV